MNRMAVCVLAAAVLQVAGFGFAAGDAGKSPFRYSSGVSVDYSDNRDSSPSNQVGNTDVSVWVGVDLLVEREMCYLLDFGYRPSLRYRTDPSPSQNDAEVYHDLRLAGWYRPNRLVRLHASEALNYTDDPAVDQGGSTIRRDSSFLLNRGDAGVEVDLSRRLQVDFSGYSMLKRYDDDEYARIGDEDSFSGSATLGWLPDRMSVVAVYGSYGAFSYAGDSVGGADRGFGYAELGISFRKEISKTLQGRIDVAYKRLSFDAAELGSEQSPCGYAALQVSPSPRLRFTGSAGYVLRDSDVTFFAAQRYADATVRAEWDAIVPKRVTLGLSGSYRVGDYKSDALLAADRTSVPAVEGQETTTVLGTDLTYRLKEWLAVSIVAQYEDVVSDVSGAGSFDRTSAGFRTRVDF